MHYDDHGHIAVKTSRFEGNCVLNLGPPYVRVSEACATAFDFTGEGAADSRAMAAATRTATMIAAEQGFPRA